MSNGFTGDMRLYMTDGILDITITGGQPQMTGGLDTCVLLAVFGVSDSPQNSITQVKSEKYNSKFLDVITGANVSDKVRNDGREAIKDSLKFLTDEKIASSVTVTGRILSAYAIAWDISITAPTGNLNYALNWESEKIKMEIK